MVKRHGKKAVLSALLVILIFVNMFVIAPIMEKPETYQKTLESIENKKLTVSTLSAGLTAASIGIAVVPDDSTTPLASTIMDLSSKLLIVTGVLVLENSLVIPAGYYGFFALIPIGLAFLIAFIFTNKKGIFKAGVNFILLGVFLASIIPVSVKTSDMMATALNANSVFEKTMAVTENVSEAETGSEEDTDGKKEKEEKKLLATIAGLVDDIKNGVKNSIDKLKSIISDIIDTIAIFLVSYFIMPIVTLIVGYKVARVIIKNISGSSNTVMAYISDNHQTPAPRNPHRKNTDIIECDNNGENNKMDGMTQYKKIFNKNISQFKNLFK